MQMNGRLQIKDLVKKYVPKKDHFVGIDIGAHSIKLVETKIYENEVEVVSQHSYPSVPGVWTDEFDEEALVTALQGISPLNEVVSCIGGEKLIMRSSRFPVLNDKELTSVVQMEMNKFLPASAEQMETRFVRLGENGGVNGGIRIIDTAGQDVLMLAVPSTTVYQYHSIFSRAGVTVTAFDLQAFALWRVYGREIEGTATIIDIGEKVSRLVVVKNGAIRFIRILPVGGAALTRAVANTLSVDTNQAQQLKEESNVCRDSEVYKEGGMQRRIGNAIREALTDLVKEMGRSLNFLSTQEMLVERIILSGGTSKLNGIVDYCQEMLGLKTEIGAAPIGAPGQGFDPAYAVALGLAMRGIES